MKLVMSLIHTHNVREKVLAQAEITIFMLPGRRFYKEEGTIFFFWVGRRIGFFVFFFAKYVLIKFPRGFPQVPNNTTLLSHMLWPKLKFHILNFSRLNMQEIWEACILNLRVFHRVP